MLVQILPCTRIDNICDKSVASERSERREKLEQLLLTSVNLPFAKMKRRAQDIAVNHMKLDLEDKIELTYYSMQRKHKYISQKAG